jgi:phage-related protein
MRLAQRSDLRLIWLHGEIKSPPFSRKARLEAGELLRRLQRGQQLAMPHSRTMSSIAPRCHEVRVQDEQVAWRIVYRVDPDAIVIAAVFRKSTQQTPQSVIDACRRRLRTFDRIIKEEL